MFGGVDRTHRLYTRNIPRRHVLKACACASGRNAQTRGAHDDAMMVGMSAAVTGIL